MPTTEQLDRYADVLVHVGLVLEEGQRLFVRADLAAAPLVRAVARRAYAAGAANVDVLWSDHDTRLARATHASDDAVESLPFSPEVLNAAAERDDAFLRVLSREFEVPPSGVRDRWARHDRAAAAAGRPFQEAMMGGRTVWSVAAAPTPTWAADVFPELPADEALEALWGAVLRACRVDAEDPVAAWRAHLAATVRRAAWLTEQRFDALRYDGDGTALTVGLPADHRWIGGNMGLRDSLPNIPTEEVFTSPDRRRVDGVLRLAKPSVFGGALMDGVEVRFRDGEVTAATAAEGQDALDAMLAVDEGAGRLGEVALVPLSSAVASEGLLWRNPLYDENDASHVAFGAAYPTTMGDPELRTREAAAAAGLNDSVIHQDVVVGSPQLVVTGVHPDGRTVPLLVHGEWAEGVPD